MQRNYKFIYHRIKNAYQNGIFVLNLLWSSDQRRHIFRWIRSLKQDYLFDTPSPWLVFDAIDYIKLHLFKGMNIFEYSSGGSTLFWLQHGANVVSIEHDPQWYEYMIKRLQSTTSVDYRLIIPEKKEDIDQNNDPSDPENYTSMWTPYRGYQFFDYVSQIDAYPDHYFDIISIDGRSRPSCMKHSVSKIKLGGIIIIDNSDREYYFQKTEMLFKNFSKIEFYGAGPKNRVLWKTTIYKRVK